VIKRKNLFFLASSLFLFFSSCRLYNLERKLNPVNAEFLSQVRYIITKEERKIFLELPDSDKEKFKEEFWRSRDPDPTTDENEFKMEYMDRLERTNELFIGEARPGYMTDRGRIYILFGPPEYKETFPVECSEPDSLLYGKCGEIWYYAMFPVVFVDKACSGNYTLVTYDLTPIRELNLMYMHELNLAQARAQQNARRENLIFDFQWKVEKRVVEIGKFEATVVIEIPYNVIWYKSDSETLKTTIDLRIELEDFEKKLVWQFDRAFEIEMTEQELQEKRNKMYKIEIPLVLEKDLDRLRQGKNLLYVTLKNRTGGDEAKKVREFKL
jgi:GWxTD domain-containing protein